MSELMTPIPFRELMTWITTEYQREGTVFGVHRPYRAGVKKLPIFGETIETPFGPAAGPNTQLAQNIIAAYFAGARFFELKTVQKMDGADLAACINRPCILANDECYNCEWSTELYVQQAFEEYVKAWCALKLMSKVFRLGRPRRVRVQHVRGLRPGRHPGREDRRLPERHGGRLQDAHFPGVHRRFETVERCVERLYRRHHSPTSPGL